MFRRTQPAILFSIIFLSLSGAQAHDGATGVVKERMDLMKTIGKNTKMVAPIAMGSADMDLKAVEDGATAIQNAAIMALEKFPEGSTSEHSEAKANIWTDWDKFSGLMKSLAADAGALAQLAKDDEDFELTDAFSKMANNCKNCHTEFRQKKN
ncbi:MAG: cytochrome c [Methylocystaceae bacterium]|nr:cytochrome c [Methylocystaceae bacterium]